jgi:SAM-dependent methyltransferase
MPSEPSYNDVAREYYRADLHPTCANFRTASVAALTAALTDLLPVPTAGPACDVGAGESALTEILTALPAGVGSPPILLDASPRMISHSCGENAFLLLGDARRLPLCDHAVQLLVASLGDPYNGREFWDEAARVLRADGVILYTCPSWEWVRTYRGREGSPINVALFETEDGQMLALPSVVLPEEDQIALIAGSGLAVDRLSNVALAQLRGVISPKFAGLAPAAPILTCYVVRPVGI